MNFTFVAIFLNLTVNRTLRNESSIRKGGGKFVDYSPETGTFRIARPMTPAIVVMVPPLEYSLGRSMPTLKPIFRTDNFGNRIGIGPSSSPVSVYRLTVRRHVGKTKKGCTLHYVHYLALCLCLVIS